MEKPYLFYNEWIFSEVSCLTRARRKRKKVPSEFVESIVEKKDELEQVYLLEEGVEQKVLYKEKEVTFEPSETGKTG